MSYSPGRYHFLVQTLERNPSLRQALIQERDSEVQGAWAALLKNTQSEISFLHGLAVMYREMVLASQDLSDELLLRNTLLWGLLLCTEEFWEHFTRRHSTWQNAAGQTFSSQRETEIMQQAIEDLLSRHSITGRRYLKEGRNSRVLIHLRCLELCGSGVDTMIRELSAQGISYGFKPDERRIQFLQEQAEKYSKQWFEEQLQEADEVTNNAEAIKGLPTGIRKYYEGGIRHLEPFLELLYELRNKEMTRTALLTCLEWYVDWCDDFFQRQMCEDLIDTTFSASALAQRFLSLCAKSEGQIRAEQRAISSYLTFQALTQRIEHARPLLKKALEWNPYNNFARNWLTETRHWESIIEKVLPYIQEYSSKELRRLTDRDPVLLRNGDQYPLIYLGLNRIPPPAYRKPRTEPKEPASKLGFFPNPPQPKEKRQAVASSAPVNQTSRPVEPVPVSQNPKLTRLIEDSKKALAGARYDEAADCLTWALNYATNDGQRQYIKQQLSLIYNLKGEKLLPEMQRRKRNGEPYIALIRAARTSFEQALEYDPGNRVAREHLAQL